MTMARFAPNEQAEVDGGTYPAFVAFIRLVNTAAPGTFGAPEFQGDTPYNGYFTEKYLTARVIHGPGDEGIRVVAETDETAAAFRQAASEMGIHIAGLTKAEVCKTYTSTGQVCVGCRGTDRDPNRGNRGQ